MFLDDESSNSQDPKSEENKLRLNQMKIFAVELLRSIKSFSTYRELASIFNIDPSTLSRYLSGHVLPSVSKAEVIITKSLDKKLMMKLMSKLQEESGIQVINPQFYYFFSSYILHSLLPSNFNKVVCFAYKDAFLGYSLAMLSKSKLILAYEERYLFPEKRIEYNYVIKSSSTGAEIRKSIALPKHSIKPNDRILIVGHSLDVPDDYLALVTLLRRARMDSKIIAMAFLQVKNKKILKELEIRVSKDSNIPIISIL